jgi:ABC-type multidrug transport system permease subunit
MRWFIIRTLIHKEILRYRYNWGLLVVVAALLVLSGLVALGSRFNRLPGQAGTRVEKCIVYYSPNDLARQFVADLKTVPPPWGTIDWREGRPLRPMVQDGEMVIELSVPGDSRDGDYGSRDGWRVRYWYGNEGSPGIMSFRDWFDGGVHRFLETRPRVKFLTDRGNVPAGKETSEILPFIVAALAIFALYLLSFNLFITSTGEEREKRVLLAILLSPVTSLEVLTAKAIFYAVSSLAVSLAVVAMYDPTLVLRPQLWLTIICGSVSYVAIGTIVVSLVRRQTTINTVAMLYWIVTCVILLLSEVLLPFAVIKHFLIENYLTGQMKQIVAGHFYPWMWFTQAILFIATVGWCAIAVMVFRRHATTIARGR